MKRLTRLTCCAGIWVLAGCSTGLDSNPTPASLEVTFELAEASQVDEVTYSVTGNGITPIEGVIDTSAPGSTASVEVFGLPPGLQYLVSLTATTTDGTITCEGAARFDVSVGVATEVHVMLGCKRTPRLGGLRANGEFNVCADLIKVIASPLQTSLSNGLALSADTSDQEGDPVAYRWTGSGGSLSDPSAAATTYTCEAEGSQTVEVEVSDDGFDHCVDSWTIAVTCVVGDPGEGDPTPALADSDPSEGGSVVPGAWLRLAFVDPVSDAAIQGFSLQCGGRQTGVTVHRLGDDGRVLVLNPTDNLPGEAVCSLSWLGPDGPTTLGFSTEPRSGASVLYDRTDPTRSVPFPDDAWTQPDPDSATGLRLAPEIPARAPDIRRVLANLVIAIGDADGFSPLGPLVLELSEAPDPASVPTTQIESLDPLATVGLFDVDPGSATFGERIPFELYVRAMSAPSNPVVQHALVLFPSIPLTPRGRYAAVITKRALAGPGRAFESSTFMSAALGPASASEPSQVTQTRDRIEPALAGLMAASPPVFADDIALVTRFTVRSTEGFTRDPLTMREQIQELPPPAFTIDRVEPGFGNVEAIVHGTWEAPEWREDRRIVRDDDGLPVLVGTKQVPFVLAIPVAAEAAPVPVTMYQHGNPGSAENEVPSQALRYLADGGHAVIGFTDNANREVGSNTDLQQAAILGPLLLNGTLPDFDIQTTGEQLAFIRFIEELDELDLVPFGNPDGQPDLDVSRPLTYDGISSGANRGQAFVPYAPEVVAAALVVGGGRGAEILFFQDIVNPDGVGSPLLNAVTLFAPSIRPIDVWLGIALYQLVLDPQDQHNHASFMYANPIEVGGTRKKPSVLVQEGIGDTFVPNNATRSLVFALGATPLVGPVAQPVPYLSEADAPLAANVDAQTTSAYAQYVPAGIPGLPETPGCEFETEGHFCAQVARGSLDQRMTFFRTALESEAPTVVSGPVNLCSPSEDCDDDDPCTRDRCEPTTGDCLNTPRNGNACDLDGSPGFCVRGVCTGIEMCGTIDEGLQTATRTATCTLQGIPFGVSVILAARALDPVGPGPVDYAVQTAIALDEGSIQLFGNIAGFADVLKFDAIVASTSGSVDPAPVITTIGDALCRFSLVPENAVAAVTSEAIVTTWQFEQDATTQEITLQDIDFAFLASSFDVNATTIEPGANCTWDMGPPRLLEMP
ncbi:MAG: hypothetical protein AAF500_06870 [Myxococcota bacterium]